jgi:hypothetical protein
MSLTKIEPLNYQAKIYWKSIIVIAKVLPLLYSTL